MVEFYLYPINGRVVSTPLKIMQNKMISADGLGAFSEYAWIAILDLR